MSNPDGLYDPDGNVYLEGWPSAYAPDGTSLYRRYEPPISSSWPSSTSGAEALLAFVAAVAVFAIFLSG